MRIAGIVNDSLVDGSGVRDVVFVQGCMHNCPGCHNPETHDPSGGKEMSVEDILKQCPSDKLTISGGDPFYQEAELTELLEAFKEQHLHGGVWVYTGFTWEEVSDSQALPYIDVLVDGVYDHTKPAGRFCGSNNQRVIDARRSWESHKIVFWKDSQPEQLDLNNTFFGLTTLDWVGAALKGDAHYGRTSEEKAASQN